MRSAYTYCTDFRRVNPYLNNERVCLDAHMTKYNSVSVVIFYGGISVYIYYINPWRSISTSYFNVTYLEMRNGIFDYESHDMYGRFRATCLTRFPTNGRQYDARIDVVHLYVYNKK